MPGFNVAKFEKAKLEPRTTTIPVPVLADFFDEGIEPTWTVRGLTASELYRAQAAADKPAISTDALLRAIATKTDEAGQVQALREALGLPTKQTPGEIAKRMEMLIIGSVDPVCDRQTAVKLADKFAVDFMNITHEIGVLTAKGHDLVKPPAASQPTTN